MVPATDSAHAPKVPTFVLGLGQTGLSVARHLHAAGEAFCVFDTRRNPPGLQALRALDATIPVYLGPWNPDTLSAGARLVISPGISRQEPAIRHATKCGAEVLGDIELFARAVRAPVVAITGSNGKSTVTALVGEMAAASSRSALVGGNFGTPALALLQQPEPDCYVLELSSFQLESVTSLRPTVAALLNISPDHMDRYPDLESYASAKAAVFRNAGIGVVNGDDPLVAATAPALPLVRFGLGAPAREDYGILHAEDEPCLGRGNQIYMARRELRLPGAHNVANALAALAIGDALGLDRAAMISTLKRYAGLPHRCQWVATHEKVTWLNDSKGTNVGATLAAVNGLPGPLVLIAGGEGKGADFRPLRAAVQGKARAVVLLGRDAESIAAAIGDGVEVARARDLAEAVAAARSLARPGDSVLFSPACASFDMFRDYAHRGEVFCQLVRGFAR